MQQLNELNFETDTTSHFQLTKLSCLTDAEHILICQFNHCPEWENSQRLLSDWLSRAGFSIQEIITGADRISWRICLQQQMFYFHFEQLSESSWFETDHQLSGALFAIENALAAANPKINLPFNNWLLDYFNTNQV